MFHPISASIFHGGFFLQGLKNQARVKLNIVRCPPVTTVLIRRPDLRYQLGFSVQNGIVSSFQTPWWSFNIHETSHLFVTVWEEGSCHFLLRSKQHLAHVRSLRCKRYFCLWLSLVHKFRVSQRNRKALSGQRKKTVYMKLFSSASFLSKQATVCSQKK